MTCRICPRLAGGNGFQRLHQVGHDGSVGIFNGYISTSATSPRQCRGLLQDLNQLELKACVRCRQCLHLVRPHKDSLY